MGLVLRSLAKRRDGAQALPDVLGRIRKHVGHAPRLLQLLTRERGTYELSLQAHADGHRRLLNLERLEQTVRSLQIALDAKELGQEPARIQVARGSLDRVVERRDRVVQTAFSVQRRRIHGQGYLEVWTSVTRRIVEVI